jgi:hypothetical protein
MVRHGHPALHANPDSLNGLLAAKELLDEGHAS